MNKTSMLTGVLMLSILLTGCQPEQDVMRPAVSKLLQSAKTAKDAGDLDIATSRLESALVLLPDNPDVLENLAVLENQQNKIALSTQHYEAALKIRPDSIDSFYGLALNYKKLAQQTLTESAQTGEKPTPGELNDAKLHWQKASDYAASFLQKAKPDDTGRADMTAIQQDAEAFGVN